MIDPTLKFMSIPIPRMTQNLYRGHIGVQTPHTTPVSVRWTDDDRTYIDRQAAVLGLSFSEFIRWVAVYSAKEVEKLNKTTEFKVRKTPKREKAPVDLSEYK